MKTETPYRYWISTAFAWFPLSVKMDDGSTITIWWERYWRGRRGLTGYVPRATMCRSCGKPQARRLWHWTSPAHGEECRCREADA